MQTQESPNASFAHINILTESKSRYNFAARHVQQKRVLDVGCGSGHGTRVLFDRGAREIVGIDDDVIVIQKAKNVFSRTAAVNFYAMTSIPWAFKDGSFDTIVALEVIEHVQDVGSFLAELKRLLHRDGLLIISTPNKKIFSGISDRPLFKYHIKEFLFHEFESLLREYFDPLQILGQYMPEYEKKFINRLIDAIPLRIKYLLPAGLLNTMNAFFRPRLQMSDCVFSKDNISDARNFIAVCRHKDW